MKLTTKSRPRQSTSAGTPLWELQVFLGYSTSLSKTKNTHRSLALHLLRHHALTQCREETNAILTSSRPSCPGRAAPPAGCSAALRWSPFLRPAAPSDWQTASPSLRAKENVYIETEKLCQRYSMKVLRGLVLAGVRTMLFGRVKNFHLDSSNLQKKSPKKLKYSKLRILGPESQSGVSENYYTKYVNIFISWAQLDLNIKR